MPLLWLYILLGVILLISLIMLLPIKLFVNYSKEIKCYLSVWFVKFQLYPSKPKKSKKKKKVKSEKVEEKSKDKKEKTKKKKELRSIVDIIKQVAKLATGVLKDFFCHIIIKNMMLSIKVVGNDAADTAVKYGYYCSAVYPAVGAIVRVVNCEKYGIDIYPDFDENAESEITFELEAKVTFFWLVVLVIRHGIRGIKLLLDLKK
jgi:hypothetical protein